MRIIGFHLVLTMLISVLIGRGQEVRVAIDTSSFTPVLAPLWGNDIVVSTSEPLGIPSGVAWPNGTVFVAVPDTAITPGFGVRVFKSTDFGQTWSLMPGGIAPAIEVSKTKMIRSGVDSIYCWNVENNNLNLFSGEAARDFDIAASTSTVDLFIFVDVAANNNIRRYSSINGGATWGGAALVTSGGAHPRVYMSAGDTLVLNYYGPVLADTTTSIIRAARYRRTGPGTLVSINFIDIATETVRKNQFASVIYAGTVWFFYTAGDSGAVDIKCRVSTDNGASYSSAFNVAGNPDISEYWFGASHRLNGVDFIYIAADTTGTSLDRIMYTSALLSSPSTFQSALQINEHPPVYSTNWYTPSVIEFYDGGGDVGAMWVGLDGSSRRLYWDRLLAVPPPPPAEAFADHVTSAMRVLVTNEGNIGSLNAFVGTGPGNGFMFNPTTSAGQRLYEGAIMVGLDSVRVSNAARTQTQVFDADFRFRANLDSSQSVGIRRIISTVYDDSLAETPFGVRIAQKTLSIDSAGANSMLIVQLDLTNTTGTAYANMHVGGFFDWDVDPATANDRGSVVVDSTNVIPGINNGNPFPIDVVEMHQGISPNSWVGVVPLDRNRFVGRRVAISSSEVYSPRMTKGDKWRYMTSNRATNPNGDAGSAVDHAQVFGSGPYSVAASATRRVGFAMVAGTSLQAIVNAARGAQRIWVQQLENSLDIIVGVTDPVAVIPESYTLMQNYPNPFNSVTQIQYALPKASTVRLTIYNVLGQEVVTLVDGEQAVGYHHVTWDGRNGSGNVVGSGLYFYRIEAKSSHGTEAFTQVKKMLFLK